MSCILTSGFTIGCKQTAGVSKVFIGEYTDAMGFTIDGTTGQITAITGATTSFYTFQQTIETASFTAPAEVSTENNAISYSQTLMITLQGMSPALINQIKTLGAGTFRVIMLDKNGNYYLMGLTSVVQVSAIDNSLGKVGSDLNGSTLTFLCKESTPLTSITSGAALSVIQ